MTRSSRRIRVGFRRRPNIDHTVVDPSIVSAGAFFDSGSPVLYFQRARSAPGAERRSNISFDSIYAVGAPFTLHGMLPSGFATFTAHAIGRLAGSASGFA